MTADLTARITEVLREHSWNENRMDCECGYGPAEFGDWNTPPEAVNAHVAALIAAVAEEHYRPQIDSVLELHALPTGVVVRSAAGTIAARFDKEYGVVFGDDRPFPWIKMALPLVVLWSPGVGE